MRIFICEDNEEMMKHNARSVKNALAELRLTADIHTYGDGDEMFQELKKNNNVDYVFLDIILPSDNGINIAKSLRKINNYCHIIFVSATNSFAVDGYEVNAFRYLLKPLTIESLVDIFNATLKEAKSRHL